MGLGSKIGKFASGSPVMFLIIRNLSGSSPMIGLTLSATGLYFFLVFFLAAIGAVTNAVTERGLPVREGELSGMGPKGTRGVTLDTSIKRRGSEIEGYEARDNSGDVG